MSAEAGYRLDGLEADNLLAFLTLLGVLRTLEAADQRQAAGRRLHPRAAWDVDAPPVRPRLFLARAVSARDLTEIVARELDALASIHEFDDRPDLDYTQAECRAVLDEAARAARVGERDRADLLAALMTDAAIKDDKRGLIEPTPLCLLYGQGHQHFLDRLAAVPKLPTPPPRERARHAVSASPAETLHETLFQPWHRTDATFSFRWDPEEDVRYALMAGDPTDPAYKGGTQHGANRLAAVGLPVLTVAPIRRGRRVRPLVMGGMFDSHGFSFAWPIWREPATLQAIRALLGHPDLRTPGALEHLGVDHVLVVRRIAVGKFMNVSRARPLQSLEAASSKKPV